MRVFIYLFTLLLTSILGYSQNFTKEIITIDSEIEGDLYIGDKDSKTVAILIAGSGPTDRNGNSIPMMTTNAYKFLAEGLAKNGINIFTYDKRAITLSKKKDAKEEEGLFEDNVNDLNLVIEILTKRFTNITLIGHSEGALVALLAANNPLVTNYISISGPGETIDKTLSKQIAQSAPFLQKQSDEILSELKQGNTVEEVIPMLQSLFRPSVQPYLISWIKYDPTIEIQKLNKPILIIQGDKDLQVDLEQGTLLQQANPNATLVTLSGMNHVFKKIEKNEDNLKSYNNGTLPIHPELVSTILKFLN